MKIQLAGLAMTKTPRGGSAVTGLWFRWYEALETSHSFGAFRKVTLLRLVPAMYASLPESSSRLPRYITHSVCPPFRNLRQGDHAI